MYYYVNLIYNIIVNELFAELWTDNESFICRGICRHIWMKYLNLSILARRMLIATMQRDIYIVHVMTVRVKKYT